MNTAKKVSIKEFRDKRLIAALAHKSEVFVGLDDGSFLQLEISSPKIDQNTYKYHMLPVSSEFHQGQIVDLDVCQKKPLLVTCGVDKRIKVWNYATMRLAQQLQLEKAVNSVSFHPTGFHLAACTKEKVILMNLLIKKIKVVFDFSFRDVRLVKFSQGGQFLAIASELEIRIFSFYHQKMLPNLIFKGHNYMIQSLQWHNYDLALFSSDISGKIYQWSVSSPVGTEWGQVVEEAFTSMAITCDSSAQTNYLATNTYSNTVNLTLLQKVESREKDQKPLFSEQQGAERVEKTLQVISFPDKVSSVLFSHSNKFLVIGMGDVLQEEQSTEKKLRGSIMIGRLPELQEFQEQCIALGGIKKMVIGQRDQMLFAIGFDNAVHCLEFREREWTQGKEGEGEGVCLREEMLYEQKSLLCKLSVLAELQNEVFRFEKKNEEKN